jgi:hypothetical protein
MRLPLSLVRRMYDVKQIEGLCHYRGYRTSPSASDKRSILTLETWDVFFSRYCLKTLLGNPIKFIDSFFPVSEIVTRLTGMNVAGR